MAKKKLTKEQRNEIRRLYQSKRYSYNDIGKMFNISLSHVGKLVKRGEKR